MYGDLIRQARDRMGISQTELAVLVDASKRSVGNWERGGPISPRNLARLSQVLGVDLVELASEQATPLPTASNDQLVRELSKRLDATARMDELISSLTTLAEPGQSKASAVKGIRPQSETGLDPQELVALLDSVRELAELASYVPEPLERLVRAAFYAKAANRPGAKSG